MLVWRAGGRDHAQGHHLGPDDRVGATRMLHHLLLGERGYGGAHWRHPGRHAGQAGGRGRGVLGRRAAHLGHRQVVAVGHGIREEGGLAARGQGR